jgi:uncharacterized damage-inducible protein DinB
MLEQLNRFLAWGEWANRETLDALRAAKTPPETALRRMAHVVGTEWLWLSRLEGKPKPMAVWPTLTLEECAKEAAAVAAAWRERAARVSEESLSRRVSYVNSKGEAWENTEGDVLMHSILHSAHHRGQIASDLRAAGFEPPYTDFIEAVRRGFVR